MDEPVEWLDDGAPYSPRFGDRYRAAAGGGLHQAEGVFLAGCGLPQAWAGQPRWTILEAGFGLGLNFLVAWAAWRADPGRPAQLHFVSVEAHPASVRDLQRNAADRPHLAPLAEALAAQYWGLRPGLHRLRFEQGRVLLTLAIGDAAEMLRTQQLDADSVFLDGFSPACNPRIWEAVTLQAIARCCHTGTRLATWTIARAVRDALAACGFQWTRAPGVPPKRDRLEAVYAPAWEVRRRPLLLQDCGPRAQPGRAVVVGAGIAGAAVAWQLARRGWQVEVLDAAERPAAGASGLPAALFAPHGSADDAPTSQLSRAGVRTLLAVLRELLPHGQDWQMSGVLERLRAPSPRQAAHADSWSRPAQPQRLQAIGWPADQPALWHAAAGWVRPARLVDALLGEPGIHFRGGIQAASVVCASGACRIVDAHGTTLAQGNLVVLAAGLPTRDLAGEALDLRPVRGQIAYGPADDAAPVAWPVNGQGHWIPRVPCPDGTIWVSGASFVRGDTGTELRPAERDDNLQRLQTLLPTLPPPSPVHDWAGVRCASPDRLPLVGPLDPSGRPGLWLCTAMGSRGLSFALLAAELLAARLHGEPLPVTWPLAAALDPRRQRRTPASTTAGDLHDDT